MTNEEKIIKNMAGQLRLVQELGNVSQACRVMGYCRVHKLVDTVT